MERLITRAVTLRVLATVGAVVCASGVLIAQQLGVANADPKQLSAFVGVGSDTTQEVMNALAGANNNLLYTPIKSNANSGSRQIASWDATNEGVVDCITPQAPGATFLRPNGSTNGRRALSRAVDGGTWPGATALCGGPKATSGLVHFARSSAGPPGPGTALTFLPFGRGALSFAYYKNGGGTTVTTLTSAQLQAIYTVGPQTINGVQIIGCLPQSGAGTRQSWVTMMGTNDATAVAATTACGATPQEHDADGFFAHASQAGFAGKQLIIAFGGDNWIAQSNGRSLDRVSTAKAGGVDLGAIDSLGKPYTGTGSNLSPSTTFYGSTTYGRDLYNVVETALLSGGPLVNEDLKTMFVGSSSAICSSGAQTTINAFGIASIAGCGSTALTGPLQAN